MLNNKIIFSDKPLNRVKRHLLFWGAWGIYFGMIHAANPFGREEISYFKILPFALAESVLVLLPQFLVAYPLLYFILPRFITPRKYFFALLWLAVFYSLSLIVNAFMIENINNHILKFILPKQWMIQTQRTPAVNLYMAILATSKGALTGAALSLAFKLGKQWYLKEQRNLQLQRENTNAQMRLLTAQVHPHFLFNTLNNIYSQAQKESPKSARMIMGLSDLLRYILYEGSKPLVPLKQELLMITEYINLEKIRYGNKLDVHVLIPDKADDLMIAPLLLLPFIENCFKHGASNMLQNPWMNLTVEIMDTQMVLKLMNGKSSTNFGDTSHSGIGITNVKQRLELLYDGLYELHIREEDEVFVVDLKLELLKMEQAQQPTTFISKNSIASYA